MIELVDVAISVIGVVGGVILAWVTTLAVQLIRAPALIDYEKGQAINTLEQQRAALEADRADPPLSPTHESWYKRIESACDGCSSEALHLLGSLVGGGIPDYVCESDELDKEFKRIIGKLGNMVEYKKLDGRPRRYEMHEEYKPILQRYINARLAADPPASKPAS